MPAALIELAGPSCHACRAMPGVFIDHDHFTGIHLAIADVAARMGAAGIVRGVILRTVNAEEHDPVEPVGALAGDLSD